MASSDRNGPPSGRRAPDATTRESRGSAAPGTGMPRGHGVRPSTQPGLPSDLHVVERAPTGGWDGYLGPVIVLVHGSLDRGASFRRTMLRLPEWGIVTYDRRGYQGSRDAGVAAELATHVHDLLAVAGAYRALGDPLSAVGHSVGGTVVLGAAVACPDCFASVGAYEPSMPWLGFHRPRPEGPTGGGAAGEGGAAREVERFFRRMAGAHAWERLPESGQQSRTADGPALVADLAAIRRGAPYDVTALRVPALVADGGPASFPHHHQTVDWLSEHVPCARRRRIPDAGHGAHLSHPDAFAGLVRDTVRLADLGEDDDARAPERSAR